MIVWPVWSAHRASRDGVGVSRQVRWPGTPGSQPRTFGSGWVARRSGRRLRRYTRPRRCTPEGRASRQEHLPGQDGQKADVYGVAYVAVEPAYYQAWWGRHRYGSPVSVGELDKRVHDRDEAGADEQSSRRLRDRPVRQGLVKVPFAQEVRKQAAEGSAECHAPCDADDRLLQACASLPPGIQARTVSSGLLGTLIAPFADRRLGSRTPPAA